MIIVVEGLSAAGKTTWCREHAGRYLIKESYPEKRPDKQSGPGEAARLWTDWNAKRWADAVSMEENQGIAVCDTDPLKLHFMWAMWQIGEAPESHWNAQMKFTRQAIKDRRLGFADCYLFKAIDPAIAQEQRDRDSARPRPNFDLHLRLHGSLIRWYETLEKLFPESFVWQLPETGIPVDVPLNADRHDLGHFDRLIDMLPRPRR